MESRAIGKAILDDPSLKRAVTKFYGCSLDDAELIKDSFNLIFAVDDLILRFSISKKKSKLELTSEIAWLQHLENSGVLVVQVIPSSEGNAIEHFTLVAENNELSPVEIDLVCFNLLPGDRIGEDDWAAPHFVRLGELVGKMHVANQGVSSVFRDQFVSWDKQSKGATLDYLPQDERNLPGLRLKMEAIFSTYPKTEENFGIIHYDVHQGNYLLHHDRINLFDFEMVCTSWYENDIAVALYYAHFFNARTEQFSEADFQQFFLTHFLAGYRKYHQVEISLSKIAHFLLYRDLFVYAFVLDAWQGRILKEGDVKFKLLLEENLFRRRAELGV